MLLWLSSIKWLRTRADRITMDFNYQTATTRDSIVSCLQIQQYTQKAQRFWEMRYMVSIRGPLMNAPNDMRCVEAMDGS